MKSIGHYGVYENKEYKITRIERGKGNLLSYDEDDEKKGFKLSENSGKKANGGIIPNIYLKRIKLRKLTKLYNINYNVKYEGDVFDLGGEDEDSYYVGTSNTDLAEKHGIGRSDKMRYDEWIPKNKCEVIEIRTDINTWTMHESNETRRMLTGDE